MNNTDKEYLRSLLPETFSDWKELSEEGRKIGNKIKVKQTKFLREHNLNDMVELRKKRVSEKKLTWQTIMGLASLEDEIDGFKYLEDFGKRTGVKIDCAMVIPNMLSGIPKKLRKNVPKGTSFVLENESDWQRIAEAANIQPAFNDFHIGSANPLENTVNAVKAGSTYSGVLAQFTWDYPGCNDDVKMIEETVKAISVVASRRDEKFIVDTYLDDGIPSYLLDLCSYLGYACIEKRIVSELCGARYAVGFGQLMDQIVPKSALWLALSETLKENDQPGVSYIFSNCIDHWDHDIEANYGILCTEALMEILVEKKYRTGIAILPIPITEKVAVPTAEAIANIHAAARRVAEKADEWEDLINFQKIEDMRDVIIKRGLEFYQNMLDGFAEAGIDINDPLQLLLVMKKINPTKLEKLFHPSTKENNSDEVIPYIPTSIAKTTIDQKNDIVKRIKEKKPQINEMMKDRRMVIASGDAHWYGQFVVAGVMNDLGVEVIDGGVGMEAIDLIDLADEEDVTDIAVSVHNGQALDYAKQLMELSKSRTNSYRFFMGGKLNGIIGDEEKPRDVTDLIEKVGVYTSETVEELVDKVIQQ